MYNFNISVIQVASTHMKQMEPSIAKMSSYRLGTKFHSMVGIGTSTILLDNKNKSTLVCYTVDQGYVNKVFEKPLPENLNEGVHKAVICDERIVL